MILLSYVEDFLSKKRRKNNGEIPQYYVEGHHEAIISPELFGLVQAEMLKRKEMSGRYSGVGIFASQIKFGQCGSWYGSKVWHSNDKYRKVICCCNHKYDKYKKCSTPHFSEDVIKEMFIKVANEVISEREELIENTKLMMATVGNTTELEKNQSLLRNEMNVILEMTQTVINENARIAIGQKEYQEKYDSLVTRYEETKQEYDEVTTAISGKQSQAEDFKNFIVVIGRTHGLCTEFNEGLWSSLIDFVTVYSEEDVRFTFKNGMEIRA